MYSIKDYFAYNMLQITCLIMVAAGVITTITNIIIGLDYILTLITLSFALFALVLWWILKKYKFFNVVRVIVSLWIFILINTLWYFNFASEGPILSLFVLLAILIVYIWPIRYTIYIMFIALCDFGLLYYIDLNYHDSLLSFSSVSDRINDTYFGLLVIIIVALVFSYYAKTRYVSKYNEAKKANELKSIFLQNMSHELRTPLNAILGFSHLINSKMDVEEILEYADIINKSGYQLLGVVNDLMDITLIEAGQLKMNKENTDFHELLKDIHKISSEELSATSKKIRLELNIPDDLKELIVYTDALRFKQILLSLLRNSIKFTEKGHINFGYEIVSIDKKSMIKVYVEDTGIGIPSNMRNTIFEPFRQVEESATKQHGGAGIGLSISKKITELLGGKIWLISEEGQGSTFYVALPMEKNP